MGCSEIPVYATEVEATTKEGDLLFKLKTFDEYTAILTMDSVVVSHANLQDIIQALRRAVEKLELKRLP